MVDDQVRSEVRVGYTWSSRLVVGDAIAGYRMLTRSLFTATCTNAEVVVVDVVVDNVRIVEPVGIKERFKKSSVV